MLFAADLHIHSRYSRATSGDLTLTNLAKAAVTKGLAVVATGDFTHPKWREEMRAELTEDGSGLLRLKKSTVQINASGQQALFSGSQTGNDREGDFLVAEPRFILSTELSTIYKDGDKTRKIHHVFLLPDLDAADRLSAALVAAKVNIFSDGRPIMGLSARELCEIVFNSCEHAALIPAHIWTPWFSVFGSKSGYDTLEECYGPFTNRIIALETGLSSDPPMNYRVSALDRFTLVSNSDAHSCSKLARECNVFATDSLSDLTYRQLIGWIKAGDREHFRYTVEFYPEEGKYHFDGHRACSVRFSPQETKAHHGICPRCNNPLTLGVCYRVDELADREVGFVPENAIGMKYVVPLDQIISAALGVGAGSQKVLKVMTAMQNSLGPELRILLQTPVDLIANSAGEAVASCIGRMRCGELNIEPGYDGEFGKVVVKT